MGALLDVYFEPIRNTTDIEELVSITAKAKEFSVRYAKDSQFPDIDKQLTEVLGAIKYRLRELKN